MHQHRHGTTASLAAATLISTESYVIVERAVTESGPLVLTYPQGQPASRSALSPPGLRVNEDPVTGRSNDGLAQCPISNHHTESEHTVRQGTVLALGGVLAGTFDVDGPIWVGSTTRTVITGQ